MNASAAGGAGAPSVPVLLPHSSAPIFLYANSSVVEDGTEVSQEEGDQISDHLLVTVGRALAFERVAAKHQALRQRLEQSDGSRVRVLHISSHGQTASEAADASASSSAGGGSSSNAFASASPSGVGSDFPSLALESGSVTPPTLRELLSKKAGGEPLNLLFLSACWSSEFVDELLKPPALKAVAGAAAGGPVGGHGKKIAHAVIAAVGKVDDDLAVAFSLAFYENYFGGVSLLSSFGLACAAVSRSLGEAPPYKLFNAPGEPVPGLEAVDKWTFWGLSGPPLRPVTATPHNLPSTPEWFVSALSCAAKPGLLRRFRSSERLSVIKSSVPGQGGSVLALSVARSLLHEGVFSGGIVWVPCQTSRPSRTGEVLEELKKALDGGGGVGGSHKRASLFPPQASAAAGGPPSVSRGRRVSAFLPANAGAASLHPQLGVPPHEARVELWRHSARFIEWEGAERWGGAATAEEAAALPAAAAAAAAGATPRIPSAPQGAAASEQLLPPTFDELCSTLTTVTSPVLVCIDDAPYCACFDMQRCGSCGDEGVGGGGCAAQFAKDLVRKCPKVSVLIATTAAADGGSSFYGGGGAGAQAQKAQSINAEETKANQCDDADRAKPVAPKLGLGIVAAAAEAAPSAAGAPASLGSLLGHILEIQPGDATALSRTRLMVSKRSGVLTRSGGDTQELVDTAQLKWLLFLHNLYRAFPDHTDKSDDAARAILGIRKCRCDVGDASRCRSCPNGDHLEKAEVEWRKSATKVTFLAYLLDPSKHFPLKGSKDKPLTAEEVDMNYAFAEGSTYLEPRLPGNDCYEEIDRFNLASRLVEDRLLWSRSNVCGHAHNARALSLLADIVAHRVRPLRFLTSVDFEQTERMRLRLAPPQEQERSPLFRSVSTPSAFAASHLARSASCFSSEGVSAAAGDASSSSSGSGSATVGASLRDDDSGDAAGGRGAGGSRGGAVDASTTTVLAESCSWYHCDVDRARAQETLLLRSDGDGGGGKYRFPPGTFIIRQSSKYAAHLPCLALSYAVDVAAAAGEDAAAASLQPPPRREIRHSLVHVFSLPPLAADTLNAPKCHTVQLSSSGGGAFERAFADMMELMEASHLLTHFLVLHAGTREFYPIPKADFFRYSPQFQLRPS